MNAQESGHSPESIAPLASDKRVFTGGSYTLMLWASLIVVQALAIGQGMLPPSGSLNLLQGIAVIAVAAAITSLFMSLNGLPGLLQGIPYCIQVRAAYGVRGAKFPEFVRLFPAILWYGVGTWFAALAFDGIVQTLSGFTTDWVVFVYFVGLQAVQTWLAYRGIRMMKTFEVAASIALVLIMGYLMISVLTTHEIAIAEYWQFEGSWGFAFWASVNALIGGVAAIILGASDLTRYLENRRSSMWWGHFLGIAPPLFFMVFLGFLSAAATGSWDPIGALIQLSPNPIALVLLLAFVFFAQFSTNLTINILPPALIFEDLLGIDWRKGVLLTGLLGLISMPWITLGSAETLFTIIGYYSAFFGPILGCMLAQRWFDRTAATVDDFYNESPSGRFWYNGGVNWVAVAITLGASIVAMLWFLKLSWLVGLPLGFAAYAVASRLNLTNNGKRHE